MLEQYLRAYIFIQKHEKERDRETEREMGYSFETSKPPSSDISLPASSHSNTSQIVLQIRDQEFKTMSLWVLGASPGG